MSHIRLTHPTRSTLEFRAGQSDEYERSAVADVVNELGTDRRSLVHTQTRESTRTVRGSVSGLRRARNDGTTADAQQALANYAATLEAALDEYQGDGYTLVDDQLDYSKNGVLERVQWSLSPGRTYELDYEADVVIGRGTYETRAERDLSPSVNNGKDGDPDMDVMATVDGQPLPGMQDFRMEKTVGMTPTAVFGRDTAENNDVVFEEGTQRTLTFEGVHSGTLAERQTADQALDALVATENELEFVTRFPGYSVQGFVTGYVSDLNESRGGNSHRFRLQFTEGEKA